MTKKQTSGEYLAPKVKVVEMKSRAVLCQSIPDGGINNMGWGSDQNGDDAF